MKVLVTGATGFVGAHTAARLLRSGASVRLFVRNPQRIRRALDPLGVEASDIATGDVTDAASVDAALEGCDAVVHSAAFFSTDLRRRDELWHTNVEGTRCVLERAHARQLDPIVHVSSISALFPPAGDRILPDDPVKDPQDMYAASKAAAERVARGLQERGAPIVSFYPTAVWGPDDPTVGTSVTTAIAFARSGFVPLCPGGIPIVDVRDIAAAIQSSLRSGRGPRRYVLGGTFLDLPNFVDVLRRTTGRRFWTLPVPGAAMLLAGRVGDFLQQRLGVATGITWESMLTLTHGVPGDSARAERELAWRARPIEETFADLLRWMAREGLLEPRQIGKLAG